MVLEMARGWFDNFKVDDKSYVFFCSELVSLCTRLLILERHIQKGMKWPITAHVAHGTAVPVCLSFHLISHLQFFQVFWSQ